MKISIFIDGVPSDTIDAIGFSFSHGKYEGREAVLEIVTPASLMPAEELSATGVRKPSGKGIQIDDQEPLPTILPLPTAMLQEERGGKGILSKFTVDNNPEDPKEFTYETVEIITEAQVWDDSNTHDCLNQGCVALVFTEKRTIGPHICYIVTEPIVRINEERTKFTIIESVCIIKRKSIGNGEPVENTRTNVSQV